METPEIKSNPDALNKMASEAKSLENETPFMKPGTKAKKGRPSKEDILKRAAEEKRKSGPFMGGPIPGATGPGAQLPPPLPSKEIAKIALSIVSHRAIALTGEAAAGMAPMELDAASQLAGAILDKWLPFMSDKFALEFSFILVMGAYGMRVTAIYRDKLARIQKMEAERKAAQNGSGPQPVKRDHGLSSLPVPVDMGPPIVTQ